MIGSAARAQRIADRLRASGDTPAADLIEELLVLTKRAERSYVTRPGHCPNCGWEYPHPESTLCSRCLHDRTEM